MQSLTETVKTRAPEMTIGLAGGLAQPLSRRPVGGRAGSARERGPNRLTTSPAGLQMDLNAFGRVGSRRRGATEW